MSQLYTPLFSNHADPIRLLIVGEQSSIRQGLRLRLDAEADLLVSGEAFDSKAAVFMAKTLCPDIVLIDVDAKAMDGLATARAIRLACPDTAVILLSFYNQMFTCEFSGDRRTVAFVSKTMPTDTLLATIRRVAHFMYGKGGTIQ
jgi:DNA-binding NarL/FixJ family response regulator